MFDTDMEYEYAGEAPLTAFQVGLGCSDCGPDAVARACLAVGSVPGHPMILHSRYCSFADPGQLKRPGMFCSTPTGLTWSRSGAVSELGASKFTSKCLSRVSALSGLMSPAPGWYTVGFGLLGRRFSF